ncbi:hypothetical protein HMPREF1212_03731 [Parabacteroides sp. HGS0025]|uniref:DUF6383 domain-containing protein n=1 Tax=Parabacteroides sp. HGS0025 TaxID=1078087 RepID=UPI000617805D|nr:DUF6383 domain-containing protein [Parabacteroides sp. HGS0025]KKB47882.1 hypothetical protein HMPREF1212_03731 [Parabacteroides sp. HGS0025]
MNKKFSTLMTMGLLMVGALFSNVNAATTTAVPVAGTSATELANGLKVYIGDGTNFAKVTTKNGVKTFDLGAGQATSTVTDDNLFTIFNFQKVNEGTAASFTFQLKDKDGSVLKFNVAPATGSGEPAGGGNDLTTFVVDKGTADITALKLQGATTPANRFQISSGALIYNASGSDAKIYLPGATTWDAETLNDNRSGSGFSFTFPDAKPEVADNIFGGNILAVTIASARTHDGKTYPAATYFVLEGGKELAAAEADEASSSSPEKLAILAACFNNATFIAMSSTETAANLDRATGNGFKFVKVKGSDLVLSSSALKGNKISVDNAQFAVTEPDAKNAGGKFQVKLASVYLQKKADYKDTDAQSSVSNLYVNAYAPTSAATYVISTSTAVAPCKFGEGADVRAALLKNDAKSVVNIMFTSGTPGGSDSEYGKYLVLGSTGSAFRLEAKAPNYVKTTSPDAQWIVAGYDAATKKFTFVNREAGAGTSGVRVEISLYPTENAGEYTIVSVTGTGSGAFATLATPNTDALAAKTIRFVDAVSTPMAGYANFSDEDLTNVVQLKFRDADATGFNPTDLYMDYSASVATKYVPSKESADVIWSLVKFDRSKAETKLVADTLYAVNTYAYLTKDKDDKTVVKTDGKDTVAVVAYALNLYGTDNYLNVNIGNFLEKKQQTEAAKAQRFIFKENANNTYAMVPVASTPGLGFRSAVTASVKKVCGNIAASSEAFDTNTKGLYGSDAYTDVVIVKDAATPSLKSEARHAAFESTIGGYVAMASNRDAILTSVLKSASFTEEDVTFWLDTADVDALTPSFFISKGVPAETKAVSPRMFLYNTKDSASYYDPNEAAVVTNKEYYMDATQNNVKAIFRQATLAAVDTMTTTVNGKDVTISAEASKDGKVLKGLNNFKYQIVQKDEEVANGYVIRSLGDGKYLYNLNGKLGFTTSKDDALVMDVTAGQSPVANEDITTSSISVITKEGAVIINGAQGKTVTISNVLGQTIANTVLSSDNATISAPAGVVVVAIEGEAAVKAIVK